MISIDEIKRELDPRIINPNFTDLKDLFEWFSEIEIRDLDQHFGFEEENYCRVPLIARDEYDLLLCCWKPGQESPFHGHPNQGCLVKILSGTLTEKVRFINGESEIRLNNKDEVGYITDKIGIHRVKNNSQENAVSLHLYAPGGYKPVFM